MERLIANIRYAIRTFWKSPGFSAVVVLSLALGIGANTAIFSLVNAILLSRLPVENPDRLALLMTLRPNGDLRQNFSYPDYVDLRDNNDVFSGVIAYSMTPISLSGDEAELIEGALVSGDYFSILGVRPALGRTIIPEDNQAPGSSPVLLLSHSLWERRFGSDPNITEKTVVLNGYSFNIIGVMPEQFKGTKQGVAPDVFVPLMMYAQVVPDSSPDTLTSRGESWLSLMGRLRPGISLDKAKAGMAPLFDSIKQKNNSLEKDQFVLAPGSRGSTERLTDLSLPLILLMAAVGLVLLIACANVANLLLSRASARRKEIAIRLAIGATRGQLIRQLLTESVMYSLIGGALGLALAYLTRNALANLVLSSGPDPVKMLIHLDARVLGFTLVLSIVTGLLFGLAPAIQASNPSLVPVLNDQKPNLVQGERKLSLRNLLVISQVAISLILVIGASLLMGSLRNMQAIDIGFKPANLLTMSFDLGLQRYNKTKGLNFYNRVLDHIETVPGVESVTFARVIPPSENGMAVDVTIEGNDNLTEDERHVDYNLVGPNYFQTLKIQLLQGRDFTRQDVTAVAIVNETMANRFWPGQDALGKRISTAGPKGPFVEIVGIVGNGKYRELKESFKPFLYLPVLARYRPDGNLIVRTSNDPGAMLANLRREIQSVDGNIPVYNLKTMTDHVGNLFSKELMLTDLAIAYGALAVLLAALGLYAVMSYSIRQQTRELGIRMAIGAQQSDIFKLVVGRAVILAFIGIVIGLLAALALNPLIASQLYGMSSNDPLVFIGSALFLLTVTLVASFIPARKAMKIDPVLALKL